MSRSHCLAIHQTADAKYFMARWRFLIAIALLAALTACETPSRWEAEKQYEQGKALFEERCKNAAGEKIYRTVSDVEGVLLLKVPPRAGEAEWQDPDWPGAAFAHERAGGEPNYVQAFLWYEEEDLRDGTPHQDREGTTVKVTSFPGYRYVDVVNPIDDVRYRYSLAKQVRPTSRIGWIDTILVTSQASGSAPRYGVTYEDHMNPAERSLGVASTTVKVVDTQTGEVLGEYTRFVWTPPFTSEGAKRSPANPTPWLSARQCGGHSAFYSTRFFVDQVLIPRKEK